MTRARGGGSKVKADGKAEMNAKVDGAGKGKAGHDDDELPLSGNFPNRQAEIIMLLLILILVNSSISGTLTASVGPNPCPCRWYEPRAVHD